MDVTLTKSASGLGFSFLMCELDPPIRDFGSLVRIKKLFPGQPAQLSSRIQEGDVLLAINGQSLKDLSYPVSAGFKLNFILCAYTECAELTIMLILVHYDFFFNYFQQQLSTATVCEI